MALTDLELMSELQCTFIVHLQSDDQASVHIRTLRITENCKILSCLSRERIERQYYYWYLRNSFYLSIGPLISGSLPS